MFDISIVFFLLWLLFFSFVGLVRIIRGFPCQSRIDDASEFLLYITGEQLKALVNSSSEQKLIFLASRKWKDLSHCENVIQLAEKILLRSLNEKILVVCHYRPLSEVLRKLFEVALVDLLQGEELNSVVDVKTFDQLLSDIVGSFNLKDGEENVIRAQGSLQQHTFSERSMFSYEHIFVDEGQEVYGDKWPDLLKMLHRTSEDPADEDEHRHLSIQLSVSCVNFPNSTSRGEVLKKIKECLPYVRKESNQLCNWLQLELTTVKTG